MTFKKIHKKCNCIADKLLLKCKKHDNCSKHIAPLSQQGSKGRFKVCRVNGDRKHCAKMAALGLYPGREMELISPENGSLCIVKLQGSNLTLDNDTTKNIFVSSSI